MATPYLLTLLAGLILSYRAGYRAGQEDAACDLATTTNTN